MSSSPSPSLTSFELGVIELFVHAADLLGIQRSVGEIYGLLFASPRPVTFQEIVDRLGISKGSASQGLRFLRSTGAVHLVYEAGDRRDFYVAETELRSLVSGFLKEKIQPHLESGSRRLEALQGHLRTSTEGAESSEQARVLRARFEKLHSWHRKGKTVAPIISKLFG